MSPAGGPRLALFCKGLQKQYGTVVAVADLDLDVRVGECFGLLGPNGAGKTTTIEILEGLLQPDAGNVRVLGQSWGTNDGALRQRLGIQLQETRLNERLTVEETLRVFRSFYHRGRRVSEVLDLIELSSKRHTRVGRLSAGQRQRLAVACSLVNEPELLFLDEPTTGLDPQARRQLWGLLDRFRASGGTILLTTHYMDEAEAVCDRVGIMDRGRLIALGTPRDLIMRLGAEHVVEFALDRRPVPPLLQLRALPGVTDVRLSDSSCSLIVSQPHVTIPALLELLGDAASALSLLTTHHATLEDVFVTLTGRFLRDA